MQSSFNHKSLLPAFCAVLLAIAGVLPAAMPGTAYGQLFVTNWDKNTVGAYTLAGGTLNAKLFSGLHDPKGIVVAGSVIYVANFNNNTIGAYTLTGGTLNAKLIQGLKGPHGIAVSGSNIFVAYGGTIGEYTTSGAVVNASLISGLGASNWIAVSG